MEWKCYISIVFLLQLKSTSGEHNLLNDYIKICINTNTEAFYFRKAALFKTSKETHKHSCDSGYFLNLVKGSYVSRLLKQSRFLIFYFLIFVIC